MKTKIILISVFFTINFCISFGQKGSFNNLGAAVDFHGGFILRHHNYIGHLVRGHVLAGELNIIKQHPGNRLWEQVYNYPQTGLSFTFMDLGNPSQLGNLFGVYPFINFPFHSSSNIQVALKTGAGLSFVTKTFDALENHKNIAIGSKFNALINLRLLLRVRLSEKFCFQTGLGAIHFSNGAFKMPNLGLNIISVNAGLMYLPITKNNLKDSIPGAGIKRTELNLEAGAGFCEVQPVGGNKHLAGAAGFSFLKRLSSKSKAGLGADLFYNEANTYKLREDSVFFKSNISNFQAGVKFCYELLIDRFSIPMEIGVYAFSKIKSNGPVYNHFGVKYLINRKLSAGLILKTHFAKADFAMIRMSYNLK